MPFPETQQHLVFNIANSAPDLAFAGEMYQHMGIDKQLQINPTANRIHVPA